MVEIKKILLIGRTGRGKSALANVITGIENKFKEGSGSISETRKIQFEKFKNDNISYLVIDTPGIGDTKLPTEKILDIIAESVYLVKDGASQVLFVTNGRFDKYEMITYDLLRETIFDKHITNYTTITRTRFENFKSKKKCEEDINLMIKEVEDKKIKLEAKEKEIKNMTSDSRQYQKLFTEVKQLKKELASTNLSEIVESCQKRIFYVNNPSIEVEDVNELELNRKNRIKSREKLLEHLKNSCQKIPYKPPKLEKLSKEIVDYMESKKDLEKKLKSLLEPKNNQNSQVENGKNKLENSSVEDIGNKEARSDTSTKNLLKFDIDAVSRRRIKKERIEQDERIRQLEEQKTKLKKEIQEKEKIIRQKVRSHIFNSYNNISKVEGGEIFIDTIIDINS